MKINKVRSVVAVIGGIAVVLCGISYYTARKVSNMRISFAREFGRDLEASLSREEVYLKEARQIALQHRSELESASAGKRGGSAASNNVTAKREKAISAQLKAVADMEADISACRSNWKLMVEYSSSLNASKEFNAAVDRSRIATATMSKDMDRLRTAETDLAQLF